LKADRAPQLKASVMLLSLIMKLLVSVVAVLLFASFADSKTVCDLHLSQIKMIPFERNSGVDAHYDALRAAGKSAVPCLIANVTNTRHRPNPRPIPGWGTMRMTVGDRAVYMLWDITDVDPIKMLPPRYQLLHKQIGVYALDEYLHDRRANRRTLQRKLWRWFRTTYLPSVR
jgi:hypothetical protein